jgi:hypothetical protein
VRKYVFVGHSPRLAALEGKPVLEMHPPEVKAPARWVDKKKIEDYCKEKLAELTANASKTPVFGDLGSLVVCLPTSNKPLLVPADKYDLLNDFLEANCADGVHWVGFDMDSFGARLAAAFARRGRVLASKYWVGEKTDLGKLLDVDCTTSAGLKAFVVQLGGAVAEDRLIVVREYLDERDTKRVTDGECFLAKTIGQVLGLKEGRD